MANPRKTGKYGSLFLHVSDTPDLTMTAKFADTFDARFETTVQMYECTRQGEGFARYMPGPSNSRLTCQAHVQALSALLALADDTLATLPAAGTDTTLPLLVRCAFKLITLATEVGTFAGGGGSPSIANGDGLPASAGANLTIAGQQIIQGFGWVSAANIQLAFDNKIIEDFTIQVDGDYQLKTTT